MEKVSISLSGRDWKRAFASAVRKSLTKTLTEPITNAYDSYKRIAKLKIPKNNGIIEAILKLNTGDMLDHAEIMKNANKSSEISIQVRIATVAKGGFDKRECQIIDHAEGMNDEIIKTKLSFRGADVSGQATGAAVRGLFGHGLGDVLFGHEHGEIHSIYNNKYYCTKASWEQKNEQSQPILLIGEERSISTGIRKKLCNPELNGTMVQFCLHGECRIPREDNIFAKLCDFYMLRLINTDPSCHVILEERRSNKYLTRILTYQFPKGEVVGKYSDEINIENFKIKIDAIMLRATTELPGPHKGEDRASGLLVVDECDAVYDQTMFLYDKDPNIEYLYGIVKLVGVRSLIKYYLDKKDEALLTESREGFETRGILYQNLADKLNPWIKQQVEKEQSRRKSDKKLLSADMEERVKEAFKELNTLYKEETGENIDTIAPGDPKIPEYIEFNEKEIILRQSRPRRVYLLLNPHKFEIGAQIILECPSDQIRIEPEDIRFKKDHIQKDRIGMIPILISSDILGASECITACAEGKDGKTYETFTKVIDTVAPQMVLPPNDGLEFRPDEVRVKPHVKRNLQLWIDTNIIKIGTDIIIRIYDHETGISFLSEDGGTFTTGQIRIHESDRHSTNPTVARMSIPFRGNGYGQSAKVVAQVNVHSRNFEATSFIHIQEHEPPTGAGIFNDIDYSASSRDLACIFERGSGMLVVNSRHPINQKVFGHDRDNFSRNIESETNAQMRLAEVVLDECIFHIAATKYSKGGEYGLDLGRDPITDIRNFIETQKFKIGPKIFQHFVTSL